MKKCKGITLVAVVITIIILIILAGISISLVLGQNGILERAKIAKKEYENSKENENSDLEKLYSSIQVATDSKVTLTMEELDEYINKKVDERINTNAQPTGIRADVYINDVFSTATSYTGITTMSGYTRTMDKNNNMSEYVSYSNQDGYIVLKERMVFYICKCY